MLDKDLSVALLDSGSLLLPDRLEISVPLPGAPPLSLWREGWFDVVAKAVGLSGEHQTRDADFDREVYVAVDDRTTAAELTATAEFRAATVALVRYRARRIEVRQGRLRAQFAWRSDFDRGSCEAKTDEARQWLMAVESALREVALRATGLRAARRRSRLGPIIVALVGAALAAVLIETWARDRVIASDVRSGLHAPATVLGVAAILLASVPAALHFKGRATAHRSMLLLLLAGIPSGAALGYCVGVGLNRWLDPGPAREIIAPIISVSTSTSRRRLRPLFLTVALPDNSGRWIDLQVGLIEFKAARPGVDCAAFAISPGAFGFEHAFDARIVSCQEYQFKFTG